MRSEGAVGLSGFEGPLASIQPDDMLFEEATRMRVAWRIASGEAERAEEARRLIDLLLARGARPEDYVLRAEAAAAAGKPDQAWATLARARAPLQRVAADRALIARARAVSNALPARVGSQQIVLFYKGL